MYMHDREHTSRQVKLTKTESRSKLKERIFQSIKKICQTVILAGTVN